jgi:hypothetical protein
MGKEFAEEVFKEAIKVMLEGKADTDGLSPICKDG